MERHFQKLRTVFDPWDIYLCPIELCFETFDRGQQLLTHYRKYHQKNADFRSPCLFSKSCFRTGDFHTVDALYKHLKLYHPSFFQTEVPVVPNNDHGPVPPNNEQGQAPHPLEGNTELFYYDILCNISC